MALGKRDDQNLKLCCKNHAKVYYTGDECPACRNRRAGLTIYKEYLNMTGLCGDLLKKLRRKKDRNNGKA
jgi:hypothetical protein